MRCLNWMPSSFLGIALVTAAPAQAEVRVGFAAPLTGPLGRRFPDIIQPPFQTYATFQLSAQAVEKAGTFESKAVADALRAGEFDTVLGRIGFDAKGDVTGYDTFVWCVWKDGKFAPVEPGKLLD